MMMNSRLSMNGVVPMMSPVTGSRSGAPDGSVSSSDAHAARDDRQERDTGGRGPRRPRRSSVGVGLARRSAASPVEGAEARLDDALGDDRGRRPASTSERHDREVVVGHDGDAASPPVSADRLVGDLGDHASIGPMIRLTPKIAPTPAKHVARPASGCRPTLRNAAAPERDEDQVAGVGGDARQHADEDQDEGEQLAGRRPRPACG